VFYLVCKVLSLGNVSDVIDGNRADT